MSTNEKENLFAGWLAKTPEGDVVYCDYDYANGKIVDCHGLGKSRPFPVLSSELEKVEKYQTVAQKIFNKKYNYVFRGGDVFVVKNYDGYLWLSLFLNDGSLIGLDSVAFLYQIPNEDGCIYMAQSDEMAYCRLSEVISKVNVSDLVSDISSHDLFATDFSIANCEVK